MSRRRTYTVFTGKDAITVRLIVRRVRPTPGSQLAFVHDVGLPRVCHQPLRGQVGG